MESLVTLGPRRSSSGSVVDLLLECHARIRTFTALAVRVAEGPATDAEVADATARLLRYFTLALPLHVADEELSIRPRLVEAAPEPVRTALERMVDEHRETEPLLVDLTSRWGLGTAEGTLAQARALAGGMACHLEAEERIILPAIGALPSATQAAILDEMRLRRAPAA